MKLKLKDGWELDCLILRKNGEKVTFKYDPLTDSLIKIVEVKEEEVKELLNTELLRANPSDSHKRLNPMKKEHKEVMPNNRKATLEQIRDIKKLAEEGKTDKEISDIVKISASNVNYWRKNTPKDLYV